MQTLGLSLRERRSPVLPARRSLPPTSPGAAIPLLGDRLDSVPWGLTNTMRRPNSGMDSAADAREGRLQPA